MEKLNKDSVVACLKTLEDTYEEIPIKGMEIKQASKKEMRLEDETFSSEGLFDFSSIFKIPKGFFGSLTTATLNEMFREVRASMDATSLKVLRNSKGVICRVGAQTSPFYKMSEIVSSLDNLDLMGGIPGIHTKLRIFGNSFDSELEDKFRVGSEFTTDFFGGNAQVLLSAFRVVCTNGLVNSKCQKFANIESDHVGTIIAELERLKGDAQEYASRAHQFVKSSREFRLRETAAQAIDEAFSERFISKTIHRKSQAHAERFLKGRETDFYTNAGITSVDTVWGMWNLFTFLSKEFVSVPSRFKQEVNAYSWGATYMSKN